jgi:hypothetical protein
MEIKVFSGEKELEINPNKVIRFHFSENGKMVEATCISLTELRAIFNERNANMHVGCELCHHVEMESKGKPILPSFFEDELVPTAENKIKIEESEIRCLKFINETLASDALLSEKLKAIRQKISAHHGNEYSLIRRK